MVKPEWGTKRICKKCSASFYDMCRDPITCPKCSSSFTLNDFIPRYGKNTEKADSRRDSKKILEDAAPDLLVDDALDDPDIIAEEDDLEEEVGHIERHEIEEDR